MKRLKITSNGSTIGTRVYDADTGEELMNVLAFRIEADGDKDDLSVWVRLDDVEIDIVATQVDEEGKAV